LAREDIQVRNRALARCQLKQTKLKTYLENSTEKTITSSAESLALHVTLLKQHVDLHMLHHECESSVVRVQAQLSEFQARVEQTESLLVKACKKYAKLTKQVDQEDQIFRYVIDDRVNGYAAAILPMVDNILESRPHLWPNGRIRSYS
jgi:hypothetical protein